MKVALCFSQYGPYHHARAKALRELVGAENFLAVQIAVGSRTYAWKQSDEGNVELVTLCGGEEEDAGFLEVFLTALRLWRREKVTAALLPSYSPATSLALLLAAKAAGLKCVMMNESHAGTERAKGWKRWIKKRLVSLFDAALVGGLPQKRHFTALGMNPEKIFTGYDAIDNDFFTREAEQVRLDADGWRLRLGLPHRYILSLGRLVEKKNLGCLIEAYAALCKRLGAPAPALVFVGSGDQEPALRNQCTRLGLHVVDLTGQREKAEGRSQKSEDRSQMSEVRDQMSASRSQQAEVRSSDLRPPTSSPTSDLRPPTSSPKSPTPPPTSDLRPPTSSPTPPSTSGQVFFHGFRQIEENPAFYALADCFVLPSLYEEWGLVVNEAMACGLPVIVSQTVGSAEDLVRHGSNGFSFSPTRPDELAEALVTLATDPALRERMGAASRQIIAQWGCDHFAKNAIAACG